MMGLSHATNELGAVLDAPRDPRLGQLLGSKISPENTPVENQPGELKQCSLSWPSAGALEFGGCVGELWVRASSSILI